MHIVITGAQGFLGRNLSYELRNIRDGKNAAGADLLPITIFEYDRETDKIALEENLQRADFVYHLAGVNRPKTESEFMEGNADFTSQVLSCLEDKKNNCPVMFASSTQAALENAYGISKRAGEDAVLSYAKRTGANAYVFRFPNLFGKWSRPNYNSAVATFCYNIAHGLPIQVNDPGATLTLLYIDDVVEMLISLLRGTVPSGFCEVPNVYHTTVGDVAKNIAAFAQSRQSLGIPNVGDPLQRKLYATYLSFLPQDDFARPRKRNEDNRGSFTELFRTPDRGQFSVNISHPGITKGNHWHHTKNEKFVVVQGVGEIRFRSLLTGDVLTYAVNGNAPEVVDIPVGYTHNIVNLGETDMVTVMWASECFDPNRPDTYSEEV